MKCSLIIFGVLACWAAPIYARRSSAAENNRQKQYLRNIEAVCAGHPDWTIVPNINDCRKFFVCINREYEEMQCAEGHHFDRISGRCASGYCANTGPTSKCQPHEVRRVADDCTAFLSCQRGSFVRNQCPAGRYFDATYSSCQPIANNPRHQCSCIMPEYTALPNNDDCSTYYTCNEGRAKLHQCPRGQFYSEDVSSCLPDLTGQCVMAPTMSPLEMPVDNVVCPEAYTSFHAHEADCNKFYLCVNGNAYVKECEKGFFFDETVRFCRFDVRQTCEKRNTMDQELPEEGLQQTDDIKNKDKHHLSGGIVVLGYHPHHNNNVDQHEENEAPIVEEHPDYQDVKPLFANQHLLAPVYDYVKEHLAGPEVAISEVPAPIDLDMKPVYVDLHLTEPLQILPPTDEEYYLQQIDADIPDLDEIQPPLVDSLLGHLHHFANEHLNKPLINQPEPLQVDQHLVYEQHQQEPLKADQHSAHHHHVESHDHSESSHSANKPQQSITDTHKQEHTGVMVLGYHHTKNEDHHQVKPVEYENQHAHHPREAADHEHEAKVHMNYHKHDESIEEPEDDSETFSVPEGDKLNNSAGSHMKNEVHTSQEAYKPQTYSAYDKLSSKFMKF